MSILVDEKTRALIQGITGKQGLKTAEEMLAYKTPVVAGVTPGKGGQEVLEKIPVFNTVKEAVDHFPQINASVIYVPGPGVMDAAIEAFDAGIPLVNIVTEHVPIMDSAKIVAYARDCGARMVGGSSVGIISPGKGRLGSIGGPNPERVYVPGSIGVISKSGGMGSEISGILKNGGFGQSTVVGIGGDVIAGTTIAECLELFQKDPQTKAVVLFGEVGGTYEEDAAAFIREGGFSKPVVAFISGRFAQSLGSNSTLGHAGAIISGGKGTYEQKVKALSSAGVDIALIPDDFPEILKKRLK